MALDTSLPIFALTNLADAATITCSTEVASLPAANLQLQDLGDLFRSTGTTTTVLVDFGASKTFDTIAFLLHNFTATATVRVRISNASDLSSPSYDVTDSAVSITANWSRQSWFHLVNGGAGGSGRYLGLTITDTSNSAGYVQGSRLVVAAGDQPPGQFSYGFTFGIVPQSVEAFTPGGTRRVRRLPFYRVVDCKLEDLTKAQRNTFLTKLDAALGDDQDFLLIPFPDDPTNWNLENIYGWQQAQQSPTNYPAAWERSFKVRERTTE